MVEFTDEEGYGRYLDLHDCYLKYINLKGSEVRIHQICLIRVQIHMKVHFLTALWFSETGLHHIPVFLRSTV